MHINYKYVVHASFFLHQYVYKCPVRVFYEGLFLHVTVSHYIVYVLSIHTRVHTHTYIRIHQARVTQYNNVIRVGIIYTVYVLIYDCPDVKLSILYGFRFAPSAYCFTKLYAPNDHLGNAKLCVVLNACLLRTRFD